jgi:hypothetical protein
VAGDDRDEADWEQVEENEVDVASGDFRGSISPLAGASRERVARVRRDS